MHTDLKYTASSLFKSSKKSIIPSIINDPGVSPGCYLAVIKIIFFSKLDFTGEVIVKIGQLYLPKE